MAVTRPLPRRRGYGTSVTLLLLIASGCAHAPPPPPPPVKEPSLVAPRVTPGSLDPKILLSELPARAERLGAGPVSLVASDQISEGERVGGFVDIPLNVCLLAYGRASPSVEDLDVEVYSEQGAPLAVDEAPDEHPTVLVCPPHPERVYVSAHAATGEGLVALGAHLVPREKAEAVGSGFGARGGVPDSHPVDSSWPGLSDAVAAHRALLGGKWQESRRTATVVDARAPAFVDMSVEANQCADALLLTDDQIAFPDAELLDDAGRVIARAHDVTGGRAVTVCSPTALRGSLAVRPHLGRGLMAVVLSRADADKVASLEGRAEIAWQAATVPLDRARTLRNELLDKGGYPKPILAVDGELVIGRRVSLPVADSALKQGCVRLDVVGGAPLALVDLSVWQDGGGLIDRTQGAEGATLVACGTDPVHVDVEARGRPGPYSFLVRKEKWQSPLFSKAPVAAARMLSRALTVRAFDPGEVRAEKLDAGRVLSWAVPVAPLTCARVAVGMEGGGSGVELRLFDQKNNDELDRAAGDRAVDAVACAGPDGARTIRVELSALAGGATVVAGVLSQKLKQ